MNALNMIQQNMSCAACKGKTEKNTIQGLKRILTLIF